MPEQAKKEIEFIFVTQMDEVLRNALESDPFKARAGTPDGGSTPDLPKPEVVPPPAPEIPRLNPRTDRGPTGVRADRCRPESAPGGIVVCGAQGR